MLNKYVWNLYLRSGGQETVDMFRRNMEDKLTSEYSDEIVKMHKAFCPMEEVSNEIGYQIQDLIEKYSSANEAEIDEDNSSFVTSAEAFDETYEMFQEEIGNQAESFAQFAYTLPYYSTELSIFFPDSFVPYYFRLNYNVLQKIADTFGIELPQVPAKKDYKERFYYYPNLCKALISFRDENNLSIHELYAFLYDFAPKYIGGVDSYIIKEIPEPHSAYFIGASREDESVCKNKDTITSWQCSPDTRAGDMIVMYIRTPVSAINSIWRACSIGFIDPFFFYYRCVYLSSNDVLRFEKTRQELRDLIKFLAGGEPKKPIITRLTDPVIDQQEGVQLDPAYDFEDYKLKVNRYVAENGNSIAIHKLTHNIPLTAADYAELQRVFTQELGTQADYQREYGNIPFGLLIRKIAKLDHNAAMEAFSTFINDASLNQKQIAFFHKIINHVEKNGYMEDIKELQKPPFDKPVSFIKLFDAKRRVEIMKTIQSITENATKIVG